VQLPRPLEWIIELDLHGDQIRTLAEAMATYPKRGRRPTYRHVALRCMIVAACVISPEVREQLHELAGRCGRLREKRISLVGMKLVATEDHETLRNLSRDPQILERLGLSSDTQAQP
jgi:hypothetical protein